MQGPKPQRKPWRLLEFCFQFSFTCFFAHTSIGAVHGYKKYAKLITHRDYFGIGTHCMSSLPVLNSASPRHRMSPVPQSPYGMSPSPVRHSPYRMSPSPVPHSPHRMVNRKLAVGFASWREAIVRIRLQRLAKEWRRGSTNDDPASQAVQHYVKSSLTRGWVGWHSWWSMVGCCRTLPGTRTRGYSRKDRRAKDSMHRHLDSLRVLVANGDEQLCEVERCIHVPLSEETVSLYLIKQARRDRAALAETLEMQRKNEAIQRRQHKLARGFVRLARHAHEQLCGRRIAEAMACQYVALALERWRAAAANYRMMARASQLIETQAARSTHIRMRNAWGALADTRALTLHRRAASIFLSSTRRQALHLWAAYMLTSQRTSAAFATVLKASSRSSAAFAWSTWHHLTTSQKLKRAQGGAAHRQLLRASTGRWCALTCSGIRRLRGLGAGVSALRNRYMRQAFNRCCENALRYRQARELARACASAFADGQLRHATNAWVARVHDQARSLSCGRTALAFGTRRAANTWRAYAQDRRVAWTALRRGASAMVISAQQRRFDSWRMITRARCEKIVRAKSVLWGRHNALARQGFNTWVSAASQSRAQFGRASLAVAEWLERGLQRAWRAWQVATAHQRSLVQSINSLVAQSLRSGVNTWCFYVQASHDGRQHRTRASSGWKHRGQRRAWIAWCSTAVHWRMLRRALGIVFGSGRRRALNTWRGFASGRTENLRRLRSMVSTVRSRNLWLALGAWRSQRQAEAAAKNRRHYGASLFRVRWQRWGMNRWMEVARGRREVLSMMGRAAAAIASRGSLASLSAWREFTAAHAEAVRTMRAVASTLVARRVRRGWNRWLAASAHWQMLRRSLANSIGRGRRRALSTWRVYANDRADCTRRLRSSSLAMMNIQLRVGINAWRSYGRTRREAMRMLKKMVTARFYRQLWRCFTVWLRERNSLHSARTRIDRALRNALRNRLRRATNSWLANATARTGSLRKIRACIVTLRARETAMLWRQWRGKCRERARHRSLFRMLHGSSTTRELFGSFQMWVRVVAPTTSLARTLNDTRVAAGRRFLSDRGTRRLRVAWQAWRANSRMQASRTLSAWMAEQQSVKMRAAIGSWRTGVSIGLKQQHRKELASFKQRLALAESSTGEVSSAAAAAAREEEQNAASSLAESARHSFDEQLNKMSLDLSRAQQAHREAEARAEEAEVRLEALYAEQMTMLAHTSASSPSGPPTITPSTHNAPAALRSAAMVWMDRSASGPHLASPTPEAPRASRLTLDNGSNDPADDLVPTTMAHTQAMPPRVRTAHHPHLGGGDHYLTDGLELVPTASQEAWTPTRIGKKSHKSLKVKRRARSHTPPARHRNRVREKTSNVRRLIELTPRHTPGTWIPPAGPLNTRAQWHGPPEGGKHVRVAKPQLVLPRSMPRSRSSRHRVTRSLSPSNDRFAIDWRLDPRSPDAWVAYRPEVLDVKGGASRGPFGHVGHEAWMPRPPVEVVKPGSKSRRTKPKGSSARKLGHAT